MIACAIYITIALASYLVFYRLTNDLLNPIGIMSSLFIGFFGIANLRLNPLEEPLSVATHFVVVLVWLELCVVGLALIKRCPYDSHCYKSIVSKKFVQAYRVVAIIVFLDIAYILIVSYFGSSGLLETSSEFDKKGAMQLLASNKIVHYISQLLPYISLCAVYKLVFDEDKKYRLFDFTLIAFTIIYCLFVIFSRGTLLVLVLGSLYILTRKFKIKASVFLLIAGFGVAGLAAYLTFRVDTSSVVFMGASGNAALDGLYNYTAACYSNLDQLVAGESPLTAVMYEFAPIAKLFGVYDESQIIVYQLGALNANTFVYGFYHDLGLVGIVVYPLIIGFCVCKLYTSSSSNHPEWILILAVFQKAIFSVFFGDYFIQGAGLGTWIPYGVIIVLVLLTSKDHERQAGSETICCAVLEHERKRI